MQIKIFLTNVCKIQSRLYEMALLGNKLEKRLSLYLNYIIEILVTIMDIGVQKIKLLKDLN